MNPTYEDGQYVLQEVCPNEINRYDVIKFFAPGDETNNLYIKRVYGLPGETIQIKENNIYINGIILEDPYFNGEMQHYGYANEEIVLDKDEYFVLGDNRNESIDSRDFICGKVPRALICSKIITK
jgi:signal peptidase I